VRIFDTFPFDGELTLLEHRLRETFDLVDYYVLVEAGETYRGDTKSCTFSEHAASFAWASAKIRHIKLSSLGSKEGSARDRAAVQRNAALLALEDAGPDDIVLLLDADEVPSRKLLKHLRSQGLDRPRRLAMTRHYGSLDTLGPRSPCCPTGIDPFPAAVPCVQPEDWIALSPTWYGQSGVVAPMRALVDSTPFALRYGLSAGDAVLEAGRHFSSVDPSASLQRKLSRVFHAEYDGPREACPDHLRRCRKNLVHHRGWWFAERPSGPLPDDLERLVRRYPDLAAPEVPARTRRRLVRAWAWLRLWRGLPDNVVHAVDRRFEAWIAFLAPVLFLCDVGRAFAGWALRLRRLRAVAQSVH
jgi:beta-1,4-mannosyl-glycoprotein beta-1,4-N-acetylglucosaminyltransferase